MNTLHDLFENNQMEYIKSLANESSTFMGSLIESYGIYDSSTKIIGGIDDSVFGKMGSGILFCDHYLYWKCPEGTINGRKLETGSISYKDIVSATISIDQKLIGCIVSIVNQTENLHVRLPLTTIDKNQLPELQSFFTSFQSQISTDGSALFTREYPLRRMETYIGGHNTETISNYIKLFDTYERNNGGFSFTWSWSGFFFGGLYLFHRKAYIEALTYFVIIFLLSSILGYVGLPGSVLLFWVIGGILSQFILFKRYQRITNKIELSTQDEKTKLQSYSYYGGRNAITLLVVSFFRFY